MAMIAITTRSSIRVKPARGCRWEVVFMGIGQRQSPAPVSASQKHLEVAETAAVS
jgi:hypothetical protein